LRSLFKGGRRVPTTKLRGFLLLNLIASLKFLRRASLRYRVETQWIEAWLAAIQAAAREDYDLACEIAALQGLVKGYGETHERGLRSYSEIMAQMPALAARADAAAIVKKLRAAALADDTGAALKRKLDIAQPGRSGAVSSVEKAGSPAAVAPTKMAFGEDGDSPLAPPENGP
jgi:indolepyruvate ferredoxin oxidoreductase beta subunit